MSYRTRLVLSSLFITVWLLGFWIADHVIEFDSIYMVMVFGYAVGALSDCLSNLYKGKSK